MWLPDTNHRRMYVCMLLLDLYILHTLRDVSFITLFGTCSWEYRLYVNFIVSIITKDVLIIIELTHVFKDTLYPIHIYMLIFIY